MMLAAFNGYNLNPPAHLFPVLDGSKKSFVFRCLADVLG